MTRFGEFIDRHRRQGINKTRLAQKTGYSRMHVHNVATGASEPTREFMDVIASACTALLKRKVDRDDLFEQKPFRGRKAGRKVS
jgi:transcriptional regulator with XRE-family HTH domain